MAGEKEEQEWNKDQKNRNDWKQTNRKGNEMTSQEHRMKPGDWMLLGGLLLVSLFLFLFIRVVFFSKGTKAVVTLDGMVVLEQNLEEDCQIPIQTAEGCNVFQIQDGKAGIVEADCRDQICVEHTAISKAGETIVCLPHKLVVEIQK